MSGVNGRREALEEIRTIIDRHGLQRADIEALFLAGEAKASAKASLLSRILALLGAIFVFSGISAFVALNWAAMNSAERIVITLGSGIVVFVLALVADSDERYRRTVPSLFVVAAMLQTTGLFVTFDELAAGSNWHAAATSVTGVMALQNGLVFWKKPDATPLFLLIAFGFWFAGTAFDWLDVDENVIGLILGASAVTLSAGLDRSVYAGLTPFWYFAGSATFLVGLYELLDDSVVELLFLAFAAGGVFLSTVLRSRLMLGVSTVGMLVFIADFTAKHFADSLGWPIVLILIGASLIVLSGLAIRVNRKYMNE